MQDKNVIKLTEQEAVLLEQAVSMLEGLENDERNRGNCSTAEGAGCSAHAVRRLASALLAHEREIGQCLHQIAETTHPTACTVEEVRAFEAAAAHAAGAVPDERAEFEAWVTTVDDHPLTRLGDGYNWHSIQAKWELWKSACAALAAAPAAAEWCVHCGATASAVCQSKCANRVCPQGLVSAAAPVVLPSGWVPCIVTYEGQHPEEVAYGPQVMMDRLKKWLERYFELKAAAPVVLPEPAAGAADAALTQAARDVLAERARQINAEGYDAAHDDEHVNDEIAAMAALFIMPEAARDWDASSTGYGKTLADAMLPWNWAMPNLGDRRRQLVKGAAMAIAELERIDRAAIAAQAAAQGGEA